MNKLSTLLFASTLTFSLSAIADHDGGEGHSCMRASDPFSEADTNHDGNIDKAEAQAMHDKHFEQMDANHDGKISKEEWAAGCKHNAGHNKSSMGFTKADKDNDGTLDKEEAKSLPNVSKHFDEIDTDKDGTVSPTEVHSYMMNQQH